MLIEKGTLVCGFIYHPVSKCMLQLALISNPELMAPKVPLASLPDSG